MKKKKLKDLKKENKDQLINDLEKKSIKGGIIVRHINCDDL